MRSLLTCYGGFVYRAFSLPMEPDTIGGSSFHLYVILGSGSWSYSVYDVLPAFSFLYFLTPIFMLGGGGWSRHDS